MRSLVVLLLLLTAPALAQPTALAEALKSPQSATSLQLAGLGLESLPPEVATLTNLKQLVLNENRLSALPDNLGQLERLEVLWLGGNQLRQWGGLSRCRALRDLDIGRNGLTEVPAAVWELTALQSLNMRQNGLSALPAGIARLTGLQVLDLGKNRLTTVPPELGQLKSLRVLDLSGNPIAPAEQARLKAALPGVDVTF